MRNSLVAAVVLVLCIGTTAAGQHRRRGKRKTMCRIVATLNSEESGKSLSLHLNEGFTVQLDELAGAGYLWQPHIEPEGILKLESSSRELPANGGMGAAAVRKFTFCAASAGSASITLELRRPWEKDMPAEKSMQIQLKVSE